MRPSHVARLAPRPLLALSALAALSMCSLLVGGCSKKDGDSTPAFDADDLDVPGRDAPEPAPIREPAPECVVPDVAGPEIVVRPDAPTTADRLTIRIDDKAARKNVSLRLCTPTGARDPRLGERTGEALNWSVDPLPPGTTQIIFRADPGNTVVGTRMIEVLAATGDAGGDASSATPTLCAAPPGNLLAYGRFDQGMNGLAPKGWSVRDPARPAACGDAASHVLVVPGPAECSRSPAPPTSPMLKALRVDSKGTWDCYAVQTQSDPKTIRAGRSYRVSATTRSTGNKGVEDASFVLGVQWLDATGGAFGDSKNPKMAVEEEGIWSVLSFDVIAPDGAERVVVWATAHFPGAVEYANVSVVEVP